MHIDHTYGPDSVSFAMTILKILGYLLLIALAAGLAAAGAFGGIFSYWGTLSSDGTALLLILAVIAIPCGVLLAALAAYLPLRRFPIAYRNVAFAALALAFGALLSYLFARLLLP